MARAGQRPTSPRLDSPTPPQDTESTCTTSSPCQNGTSHRHRRQQEERFRTPFEKIIEIRVLICIVVERFLWGDGKDDTDAPIPDDGP